MIRETSVDSSLHSNCHNQIVFAKFVILKVNIAISKTKFDLIQQAMDSSDWSKAFENVNVDIQVEIFNKTNRPQLLNTSFSVTDLI